MLAVVAGTAAVVLATACSGNSSSASNAGSSAAASGGIPAGPIKVGVIAPLSGQLAGLGTGIYQGIKTFVDEINASGGVNGHQLELLKENDANDPATGVAAAQKLKAEGAVADFSAGIGPVLDQVLPVLMKEKIIVISNDAFDAHSSDVSTYPYFFAIESTNDQQEAAIADYAVGAGAKKIGAIEDGLPFSIELTKDFNAEAAKKGATIAPAVTYSPTALDLSTQVAKLKAEGVDTIADTGETQLGALYAAVKQLNWNPLIAGTAVTPLTSPEQATSNTVYPCFAPLSSPDAAPDAGRAAAIAAVKAAGAAAVIPDLAPVYRDAVQVFVAGVKKANSTDPDAVKAAIETLSNASFTSPAYTYTYTATNHAGARVQIDACHLTPVATDGLPVGPASS